MDFNLFDINNKFSLFFVVSTNISFVSLTKRVNLPEKNQISAADVLLCNFTSLFLDRSTSILKIKYETNLLSSSKLAAAKRLKHVKINFGLCLAPTDGPPFLFILSLVWNFLIYFNKNKKASVIPLLLPSEWGHIFVENIFFNSFLKSCNVFVKSAAIWGAFLNFKEFNAFSETIFDKNSLVNDEGLFDLKVKFCNNKNTFMSKSFYNLYKENAQEA